MSVGSSLAAARRERKLTVDDLSAGTKIRPHLIRAIEADDFAACGGDVYARGHVRSLARALGLAPEPFLEEMASAQVGGSRPIRAPAMDPSLVIKERRVAPRWTMAMAVILGIIACLAALRLIVPSGGDSNKAVERQPIQQPSGQPYVRPSTPGPSPSSGVAVSFTVTGSRCWLSVIGSDGVVKIADVLRQGQTKGFSDHRKLSVVVGNVGAVQIAVNGQAVTVSGATGSVKRFVVRANDPLAAFGDSTQAAGAHARAPAA